MVRYIFWRGGIAKKIRIRENSGKQLCKWNHEKEVYGTNIKEKLLHN